MNYVDMTDILLKLEHSRRCYHQFVPFVIHKALPVHHGREDHKLLLGRVPIVATLQVNVRHKTSTEWKKNT